MMNRHDKNEMLEIVTGPNNGSAENAVCFRCDSSAAGATGACMCYHWSDLT